jgi:hypothetical protein
VSIIPEDSKTLSFHQLSLEHLLVSLSLAQEGFDPFGRPEEHRFAKVKVTVGNTFEVFLLPDKPVFSMVQDTGTPRAHQMQGYMKSHFPTL